MARAWVPQKTIDAVGQTLNNAWPEGENRAQTFSGRDIMKFLKMGGWAFCLGGLVLAACTQTASRQEPAPPLPDLMEALPPAAHHAFLPPDPQWRKKVTWLEPQPDVDGRSN